MKTLMRSGSALFAQFYLSENLGSLRAGHYIARSVAMSLGNQEAPR